VKMRIIMAAIPGILLSAIGIGVNSTTKIPVMNSIQIDPDNAKERRLILILCIPPIIDRIPAIKATAPVI